MCIVMFSDSYPSVSRNTQNPNTPRTTSTYTTSSSLPSFQNAVLAVHCPSGFTLNNETQVCDGKCVKKITLIT